MAKKLLLLDMDGCIANFSGHLLNIYNEKYNTSFKVEDWNTFEVENAFGKETWGKMEDLYNSENFFLTIPPYEKSLEVIRSVVDRIDIEICTTPTKISFGDGLKGFNPFCVAEKIKWVMKHLPTLASKITFTKKKNLVRGDILVDDALHNIAPWAKAHPNGIGFLVDRPWNQTPYLAKNCIRGTIEQLPEFLRSKGL